MFILRNRKSLTAVMVITDCTYRDIMTEIVRETVPESYFLKQEVYVKGKYAGYVWELVTLEDSIAFLDREGIEHFDVPILKITQEKGPIPERYFFHTFKSFSYA